MFEKYIFPAILILLGQISYLGIHTVRLSLTLKGKKQSAFFLSFIEISVYLIAINLVLTDIKNPVKIASYILGYALGILLGMKLDSKLAIGKQTLLMIPKEESSSILKDFLKETGCALTILKGFSKSGKDRDVFLVIAFRKNVKKMKGFIDKVAPDTFITVLDTRHTYNRDLTQEITNDSLEDLEERLEKTRLDKINNG
jgi:uncharacterized protein YebE (UPF0316 family)